MKILVPLFALLLIGGTASAQDKGRATELYHLSWTNKQGKQKCHNGASLAQAEKSAAKKRTKKGVTKVMVAPGKCDRDRAMGAVAKPGLQKPKPSGQKPQVGRPTSNGNADKAEVMRKEKEKKEKKEMKEKEKKEKEKEKKEKKREKEKKGK